MGSNPTQPTLISMNIIDKLTGGKSDVTWKDVGACVNFDMAAYKAIGNPFFEGYEADEFVAKAIDEMCNKCPVQKMCGEYARDNKEEGVWGGIYWTSRGTVDTNKNSHKTKRDWERLRGIFGEL